MKGLVKESRSLGVYLLSQAPHTHSLALFFLDVVKLAALLAVSIHPHGLNTMEQPTMH